MGRRARDHVPVEMAPKNVLAIHAETTTFARNTSRWFCSFRRMFMKFRITL